MAGKVFESLENQISTRENVSEIETGFQKLNISEEDYEIPTWLKFLESPFNWLPTRFSEVPSEEVITKAVERIEKDEGFDATFPFEKFVRILTLVFEYSHQEKNEEARKQLMLCDQLLAAEDVGACSQFGVALTETVRGTRAHVLFRSGNIAQAKETALGITAVNKMSANGQAALQGMKARFFYHYRCRGAKLAVQHARAALSLVPGEPLWQVLAAEAIRRLRKFLPGMDLVASEEVLLLERAISKQRSAKHLVLLAQAYRECADSRFKHHRAEPDFFQSQIFHDISDMQAKAFQLYKEALSLSPDHEVVNRLCGYGLLKLPAFKSDYRLAERCLQKALELSPKNPTTIHSLGLYYYKGLMEYEKAALFCEKAGKLGNFPASLDMLRMKRLVYGNNYDPVFDFGKLLKQYGDDITKRHEILCQMGSYYLFFERNLIKALTYFKRLIEEQAEQSIITNHKCTFLNMACKINLFECIVNEGTQLLQRVGKVNVENEKNYLHDVKSFLDELKKTNPDLFICHINPSLIDDLHKVSDNIKQTYIRKKERRDSYKDKRRNYLNMRRSSLDDSLTIPPKDSANLRRRSSGNISDTLQNHIFRHSRSSNNKHQMHKSINISGSIEETFQETKQHSRSVKYSEFDRSRGPQNEPCISVRSHFYKNEFKSKKQGNEKAKMDNWRMKEDKNIHIAPP